MNKKDVLSVCDQYGIFAKKSLGQNFLCNEGVAEKIVAVSEITSQNSVLEIGPGIGALSAILCREAKSVVAIEIDKKLVLVLNELLGSFDNLKIIEGDYLQLSRGAIFGEECFPEIIISNLPYYITTPIILKLINEYPEALNIVLMVEHDACERIFACPGSKSYGILSVITSLFGHKEHLFFVDSASFYPAPHTKSAVIKLSRDYGSYQVNNDVMQFVRAAFVSRRKTLMNSLSIYYGRSSIVDPIKNILKMMNLPIDIRAEMLTPQQLMNIRENLQKYT